MTDAKNHTTTYTYEEMDRLKTRADALSRTESYQYDLNGNLLKFTDRKSQQATFTYDALNRRTGATYPDATVTFGYDAIGRLTSVSDSVGGTITWTYDTVSSGHHPRVQETTTPGTVTVEYDEIGRRVKLSATGQTDVTYTYDKNSRLKTVTQGSQTVTLAYDDAGRRTGLTYPNGVVTSYGYDNANRLLSINHVKTPTTIEALTYQNDAAGNRTKLTRANAAASLIPQAVTNTAFDAANEQTRFNSASTNLVYDNNGNLTSFTDASGTTTYTWNARNQLTAISGPSLSASFVYDGLGRRTSKTINSSTTGFWYDGADVLAELSGSTPTATYIRSLSIDEPFIRKQSGGDEFYQGDALGTTLALTDTSGTAQTTYTYEPFGKTQSSNPAFSNSFQFTGRENDGTGLYFYRARYYSPQMQRFIGEDPIGFRGGDVNLYAYVHNAALRFNDPLGLAVGDWWDLPANLERSQQIAREELANRPGSHNDLGDAMRHAEWMRRTTTETNTLTAWIAGTGHEIEGVFKGQPWDEMLMDLHNNSVGRDAGRNNSVVDPRNLWTLPLKYWQYNPYSYGGEKMRASIVVICGTLTFLIMAACTHNKGSFLLLNKSKESIARALVTVCGQTIELKSIKPTNSASGSYEVKSDSHYDVRVEFDSGRKLRKEIGYVTNGLDFNHEIVVTDTDIEITDSKIKVR